MLRCKYLCYTNEKTKKLLSFSCPFNYNELIKSSPEARKAAEEFDKEYTLQKEANYDRQADRQNKPNKKSISSGA